MNKNSTNNINNANSAIDPVFSSYRGDAKSFTIPEGVTWIADGAFKGNTTLERIKIPDSVTYIGKEAFMGCTSLKTAILPENPSTLSPRAFMGCTSLEVIAIPNVKSVGDEAFKNCTSLKAACVYEDCEEIGFNAFNGCTSLEYVELPDGIKEICGGAFDGCTSLKEVKTNENLEEIFDECFMGCDILKKNLEDRARLYEKFRNREICAVIVNDTIECFDDTVCTDFAIPDGVTTITAKSFKGCSRLEELTIPESVTEIELEAFDDCVSLSVINVPDNFTLLEAFDLYNTKWYKDRCDGLVVLGTVVLEYGGSEKLIQLPDGITSIFENAFDNCTPDCELVLPKNAKCIKRGAYSDTDAPLLTVHY